MTCIMISTFFLRRENNLVITNEHYYTKNTRCHEIYIKTIHTTQRKCTIY